MDEGSQKAPSQHNNPADGSEIGESSQNDTQRNVPAHGFERGESCRRDPTQRNDSVDGSENGESSQNDPTQQDNPKDCSETVPFYRRFNFWILAIFHLLAGFRILTFIVFSHYDMQCLVKQHASVIDCNQETFLQNPEVWVLVWILVSIVSSLLFFVIVYRCRESLNIRSEEAKLARKKGSFISFMILALLATTFYFIRIFQSPDGVAKATSVFLFLWSPVMFLVVWCVNYTLQVRWKPVRTRLCSCCRARCCCTNKRNSTQHCATLRKCFKNNFLFFFYWVALFAYFVESFVNFFSVLLDVAYKLAPLLEKEYNDKSLKGFIIIFITFRAAFYSKLVYFFWQKMFHGEKDLFSEPCAYLGRSNHHNNSTSTNREMSTLRMSSIEDTSRASRPRQEKTSTASTSSKGKPLTPIARKGDISTPPLKSNKETSTPPPTSKGKITRPPIATTKVETSTQAITSKGGISAYPMAHKGETLTPRIETNKRETSTPPPTSKGETSTPPPIATTKVETSTQAKTSKGEVSPYSMVHKRETSTPSNETRKRETSTPLTTSKAETSTPPPIATSKVETSTRAKHRKGGISAYSIAHKRQTSTPCTETRKRETSTPPTTSKAETSTPRLASKEGASTLFMHESKGEPSAAFLASKEEAPIPPLSTQRKKYAPRPRDGAANMSSKQEISTSNVLRESETLYVAVATGTSEKNPKRKAKLSNQNPRSRQETTATTSSNQHESQALLDSKCLN